jgi:predicted O-linked N-acetylglucosamine transferase (SPINDLY family)/cephalosporin hydroxylase
MLNAEQDAIRWFHKLYYDSGQKGGTWLNTRWMGVPILKCPLDLWIYQEILFEIKPELIIECGTFSGGSALFLAHLCELIGCGEIVSIDLEKRSNLPHHSRISYWFGSSISEQIVESVREKASGRCPVLVILDSDHRANHVLQELRLYSSLVTPGSYVIIEDTNVNGHPVAPDFGPGPMEAVQAFLRENHSFFVDTEREKFGLTFNPSGYLKRKHIEVVIPQLSSNINQSLNEVEIFIESLDKSIVQYQKNSTILSLIETLREFRKELAKRWLIFSNENLEGSYLEGWSKANQLLLNSGIKTEPLTQEEQTFVDELVAHIAKAFDEPKAVQYLLAAMLYCRADQLQLQHDLRRIPHWFLNDYLKFVLYSPQYFQEVGEADSYYRYMQQWIDYIHTSIFSNPDSALSWDVAVQFIQEANFIPLYFNEANLKNIYIKRTDILEYVLKSDGHEVDYDFAASDSKRKKIRLGILASHFTPAAETFASLPIYEYLSRDFEVILYSLSQTGHQLEQYCQSCANSFKLLPHNLKDQVNCIRADDLDILFIATNITAGTSQICLLSLHRLARVQVTSIASIVTTGIRNIDYYVSGKLTDQSSEAEHHYREQLLRLEGSAHCFSYGSEQNTATVKVDRKKLGISEESVVFVSVANMFKITPELSHTWAKIIASVPNSVLLLFPFGPNWSNAYPKKTFLNNINKIFSEYGLQQTRCITLAPVPVPNRDDIKEYLKLADVYLDSYPFSGTTSLIEPLEVGLPIVARQGNCLRSAMGAAILQDIGMHDLVANSEESYIQLAIALGTEPELRKQKSDQIKQKMQSNPRFLDSRSYSAQMGALFQELLRKYQADALSNELKLRDINLIIFPDWSQPEELVSQDLASVIKAVVTHPAKSYMTLLVDTSNIAEEEGDLAVSGVVMNLAMEEELDVEEGPEISLTGKLSEMQWSALLPRLQARIILDHENQQAIAQANLKTIPSYELDNFTNRQIGKN